MPVIGIPLRYTKLSDERPILFLGERIRRTFQKAGAIILPICQVQDCDYINTKYNEYLPLTEDEKETINKYLDMVDGVVFPGGKKITPFDEYLLKRCIERKIPTLGICLGMQLMSCFNEKFEVYPNEEKSHFQDNDLELTHKVKIQKETLLYEILGKEEILVNSFHNYHVEINNDYKVNAISDDGFVEGIELADDVFSLGIQWHPEISYDFDENSKKIIDYFIDICSTL
ncbi:MAG: gamma-glutamyl-gamma-aminobutyrate hydrolase family protein [Bacilli bacterium]|nr:gamma-glutamyl-gamma-aminobutyrate hydrolase family protein [Bacilli bacterium]